MKWKNYLNTLHKNRRTLEVVSLYFSNPEQQIAISLLVEKKRKKGRWPDTM